MRFLRLVALEEEKLDPGKAGRTLLNRLRFGEAGEGLGTGQELAKQIEKKMFRGHFVYV